MTDVLAIIDVAYDGTHAYAGAMLIEHWTSATSLCEIVISIESAEDYTPGEFYKKELPPIMAVLAKLKPTPSIVVVDGHTWLNRAQGRKGLGAHVHDALGATIPVVGIAKNAFTESDAIAVTRGQSKSPLYVTSAGIPMTEAAEHLREMHGEYRIPTQLKAADALCRAAMLAQETVSQEQWLSPVSAPRWNGETWLSYWPTEDISVEIAGTATAPSRVAADVLTPLIKEIAQIKKSVFEFVSSRSLGYPVSTHEELQFVQLEGNDEPPCASLFFTVRSADPYILYEAIVEGQTVVAVKRGFM